MDQLPDVVIERIYFHLSHLRDQFSLALAFRRHWPILKSVCRRVTYFDSRHIFTDNHCQADKNQSQLKIQRRWEAHSLSSPCLMEKHVLELFCFGKLKSLQLFKICLSTHFLKSLLPNCINLTLIAFQEINIVSSFSNIPIDFSAFAHQLAVLVWQNVRPCYCDAQPNSLWLGDEEIVLEGFDAINNLQCLAIDGRHDDLSQQTCMKLLQSNIDTLQMISIDLFCFHEIYPILESAAFRNGSSILRNVTWFQFNGYLFRPFELQMLLGLLPNLCQLLIGSFSCPLLDELVNIIAAYQRLRYLEILAIQFTSFDQPIDQLLRRLLVSRATALGAAEDMQPMECILYCWPHKAFLLSDETKTFLQEIKVNFKCVCVGDWPQPHLKQ